ncbi:MAG: phosphoadenylyl-sulfate reductase [Cyanobacteria bacterium J06621_15]
MFTEADIAELNKRFENVDVVDILAWCNNSVENLIQVSSFSVEGLVIIDIFQTQLSCLVPVMFIDTLFHFKETLQNVEANKRFYLLDLRVFKPLVANNNDEFVEKYGDLWKTDPDKFHQLTKIDPLRRGLDQLQADAWISGRRRSQSKKRENMPIFEHDCKKRLKINPLATWSREQVWEYAKDRNLLYNPLYDKGYASIGDEPLTTPIEDGEGERAGRWRGSDKNECGMHE